ncbi:hypothetical protein LTR53_004598 [Teratosphaeriaceae sp. CCFEE 6253]|nr:hypothetical protein LTR53_004598 [Teratosphaeriaceae sp. CCFEE 6253]
MKITAHLSYLLYAASIAVAAPMYKRAGTSYSGGTTANDVEAGVCAPITFIFARGSTEPGTMGRSVGPGVAKALIASQGKKGVAIQGVDYVATMASNMRAGSGGGPVMAQLVKKALQQCPDTKIALSGYSQGGMVVHNAMRSKGLSASQVSSACSILW